MQTIRLALRNLTRQKKRSFLLGGAIAFGILIVTVINGFAASFVANVSENFANLAAGHIFVEGIEKSASGRENNIVRDDQVLIAAARQAGVPAKYVTKRSAFEGTLINEGNSAQLAISGVNFEEETFLPDRLVFKKGSLKGMSVEAAHELTKIDPWFLEKLESVLACERALEAAGSERRKAVPGREEPLSPALLAEAKRLGFSDDRLGELLGLEARELRRRREALGIKPAFKRIDTLAAEYPAKTNYLYATYSGESGDVEPLGGGVMVVGSGAYRIGSSVEFDWCCVKALETARSLGHRSIMVNCNPETVSTDYDVCDRLYFEELSLERVLDIYEFEHPEGIVLSMTSRTLWVIMMIVFPESRSLLRVEKSDSTSCSVRTAVGSSSMRSSALR